VNIAKFIVAHIGNHAIEFSQIDPKCALNGVV
jgi:hypothetical protein